MGKKPELFDQSNKNWPSNTCACPRALAAHEPELPVETPVPNPQAKPESAIITASSEAASVETRSRQLLWFLSSSSQSSQGPRRLLGWASGNVGPSRVLWPG